MAIFDDQKLFIIWLFKNYYFHTQYKESILIAKIMEIDFLQLRVWARGYQFLAL
jgi:hypothetical protein